MLRRADEEVARRLGEAERSAGRSRTAAAAGGRRHPGRVPARRPRRPSPRPPAAPGRDRSGACGGPRVDRRGARRRRAGRSRSPAERAEQERTSAWAESERRRAHGARKTSPSRWTSAAPRRWRQSSAERVRTARVGAAQQARRPLGRSRAELGSGRADRAPDRRRPRRPGWPSSPDLRARSPRQLRGTQAALGRRPRRAIAVATQPPSEPRGGRPSSRRSRPRSRRPRGPGARRPRRQDDAVHRRGRPGPGAPAPEAAGTRQPAGPPTLILDSTTLEPPRSTRRRARAGRGCVDPDRRPSRPTPRATTARPTTAPPRRLPTSPLWTSGHGSGGGARGRRRAGRTARSIPTPGLRRDRLRELRSGACGVRPRGPAASDDDPSAVGDAQRRLRPAAPQPVRQHAVCQWRRSATDPCSPPARSRGGPFRAAMSWSQPGHR